MGLGEAAHAVLSAHLFSRDGDVAGQCRGDSPNLRFSRASQMTPFSDWPRPTASSQSKKRAPVWTQRPRAFQREGFPIVFPFVLGTSDWRGSILLCRALQKTGVGSGHRHQCQEGEVCAVCVQGPQACQWASLREASGHYRRRSALALGLCDAVSREMLRPRLGCAGRGSAGMLSWRKWHH